MFIFVFLVFLVLLILLVFFLVLTVMSTWHIISPTITPRSTMNSGVTVMSAMTVTVATIGGRIGI